MQTTMPLTPLRSAFSLTKGERALAVAVGATAWILLPATLNIPLPLWLPFVLCNALAVSGICALRCLQIEQTRAVSHCGYGALTFPALQTVMFAIHIAVREEASDLAATPAMILSVLVIAHAVVSVVACMEGVRRADRRGNIATLPLLVAWCFLAAFLLDTASSHSIKAADAVKPPVTLRPVEKHDVSLDKFAEAWAAHHKVRPALVTFDVEHYPGYAEAPGDVWAFNGAELFELRNNKYVKRISYLRGNDGVGKETREPTTFDPFADNNNITERNPTWDDHLKPLNVKPVNRNDTMGIRLEIGPNGRVRQTINEERMR